MRYKFKRIPYAHQVAALNRTVSGWRERGSYALLMDPRTGKTKVAIDAITIAHLSGKMDRVLVVCPVSVIGVWQNEIELNCPVPHRVVVWDRLGRRSNGLPAGNKLTFVLINYDAFSTPGALLNAKTGRRSKARGGRFDVQKRILRWHPHCIVLDESHRIKTPRAKKTMMLQGMGRHVPYRLILTGTVVTKKKRIFDIYSQWKFLNPQSPLIYGHTLGSFKQTYGVWTSRNGYPQWLRNKSSAMPRLRRLLHAEAFAVTRAECFDLPPERSQIIPIELTGHNAELYDEMAEDMVARIKTGEITEASIKIVQTLRLGQLTSGIARTTPTVQHPTSRLLRVGRDKLIALQELLTDLFEAEEHVVVCARWRADLAAVARMCEDLKVPCFQIHGGIPPRDRIPKHVEPFNALDGAACFAMQPAAGGLGIDLSSASICIWLSLTNSWVDYKQAKDRIALSNRSTIFMYLIARGTVDEVMYDTLMEDGDLAKAVTESPELLLRDFKRPWTPREQGPLGSGIKR
jgi:SNF2 family DNA or RNA helicase